MIPKYFMALVLGLVFLAVWIVGMRYLTPDSIKKAVNTCQEVDNFCISSFDLHGWNLEDARIYVDLDNDILNEEINKLVVKLGIPVRIPWTFPAVDVTDNKPTLITVTLGSSPTVVNYSISMASIREEAFKISEKKFGDSPEGKRKYILQEVARCVIAPGILAAVSKKPITVERCS